MKYSLQDKKFIIENYPTLSSSKIAEALGRKQGSVSRKIRELGIVYGPTQQLLLKNGKRKCRVCKNIISLYEFSPLESPSNKQRYSSTCKKCQTNESMKCYYRMYDSVDAYCEKIIKILSKRKGCSLLPSDIKAQWDKQGGKCFYSGELLVLAANYAGTVSIDRIDSTKPYSSDNIVLCCRVVNVMKQSFRTAEFIEWCEKIVSCSKKCPSLIAPSTLGVFDISS